MTQDAPGADERPPSDRAPTERLHKFLASTGAGSRRECETFIATGRVTLNGQVVTKMGVKVDPSRDEVRLDGEPVRREERVYYLLHKPAGTICTNSDERGRPRAIDLINDRRHRIYTVGRLDADSTGLILCTNDGEISNILCHPRYRIEKVYQVAVRGEVSREDVAKVEAGVWLAEGRSSPAKVRPIGRNPRRDETILEMTIFEGRNREIRRVFAKVGLSVRRLTRVRIGPIEIGDLPPGAWRPITRRDLAFVEEAERLYLANREAWDAELPTERRHRRPPQRKHPSGPKGRRAGARRDRFGGGREGDRGPRGERPPRRFGERPPFPRRPDGDRGPWRPGPRGPGEDRPGRSGGRPQEGGRPFGGGGRPFGGGGRPYGGGRRPYGGGPRGPRPDRPPEGR